MRFVLETRSGRPVTEQFSERLVAEIERHGSELVTGEDASPDMVLAVGGDGTMLAAVRRALGWDVPALGFNLGTLGFLTEAEADDVAMVVERLVAGDYSVQERMTIAAQIGDTSAAGLNDVVVEKIDTMRLVSLDVSIDGQPFTTYRADGLVFATPTGSTAYSFSAGGPLVVPGNDVIVMTPVAAHSLFDRSMVLPSSSLVEVTVSRDRPVRVNVDKTDLGRMTEGDTIRISRHDRPARFVSLGDARFSSLVRDKFGLD